MNVEQEGHRRRLQSSALWFFETAREGDELGGGVGAVAAREVEVEGSTGNTWSGWRPRVGPTSGNKWIAGTGE